MENSSSTVNQDAFENNFSKNSSENHHIYGLLNKLIDLQKKSTLLETAIKQQGREIKMDILPDGYDKRMAPPRVNGMLKFENILAYITYFLSITYRLMQNSLSLN